jgi:elongator complex protein 3
MNDFSGLFYTNRTLNIKKFKEFFLLPGAVNDKNRIQRIHDKLTLLKKKKSDLEIEKRKNETSVIRCVALCLETKPDYCRKNEINESLKYGVTRIELGVQTLKASVLKHVNRGHGVKDVVRVTQLMKDSFLKVGYHMMPGLPLTSKNEDILMLNELFTNTDYKPDALKIYPTMVMPGTKLAADYKAGKYSAITSKMAAEIIVEAKKNFPEWVRVMRVQRDIPTKFSLAGVDMNNLRQLVDKFAKEKKVKCHCIHCREPRNKQIDIASIQIKTEEYAASGGAEVFLSAVDTKNDILAGFCRLRIPYKPFRKEIPRNSAGIRELHVYSQAVGIGKKDNRSIQHIGIGKKLLAQAENIAVESYGAKKMLVISGVGVRQYYYKLGYKSDGVYVSKPL